MRRSPSHEGPLPFRRRNSRGGPAFGRNKLGTGAYYWPAATTGRKRRSPKFAALHSRPTAKNPDPGYGAISRVCGPNDKNTSISRNLTAAGGPRCGKQGSARPRGGARGFGGGVCGAHEAGGKGPVLAPRFVDFKAAFYGRPTPKGRPASSPSQCKSNCPILPAPQLQPLGPSWSGPRRPFGNPQTHGRDLGGVCTRRLRIPRGNDVRHSTRAGAGEHPPDPPPVLLDSEKKKTEDAAILARVLVIDGGCKAVPPPADTLAGAWGAQDRSKEGARRPQSGRNWGRRLRK